MNVKIEEEGAMMTKTVLSVAPLVKSDWCLFYLKKDVNVITITGKRVKAIFNKRTEEKFDRLANEICEIPISSHRILCKMMYHVYEKDIYELSFGYIFILKYGSGYLRKQNKKL